jgi:hypothetical protein
MSKKSWQLSRRHMLRGVGATMGLPLLEAMMPSGGRAADDDGRYDFDKPKRAAGAAGAEGQPVRFAAFFMPNGVNHSDWDISPGKITELSRTLYPLEPIKEYVNVFGGLRNSSGGHDRGTSSFLTGRSPKKTENAAEVDVGNGSVDQLIATACGGAILPSLELGMSPPRRGSGDGITRIYGSHICWKDANTPVPHEMNPQRAFDRLFRSFKTTRVSALGKIEPPTPDKSVIDIVLEDAKSLMKQVGRADQQKLDQYLSSVREVEDRIINKREANQERVITPDMSREIYAARRNMTKMLGTKRRKDSISAVPQIGYREYGRLMMDVMALAFWSNSTRVSTLMFGDGSHGRNMSFIDGVEGNHHSISHHGNKKGSLEMFSLINTFFVEQYAYFLGRLQEMEEGSSNVLENSMVLLGSNMGDGQNHSSGNIPIVVAGRGGGRITTGRSVRGGGGVPNLHRSVLDTMNLKSSLIGGGGGTLGGFKA